MKAMKLGFRVILSAYALLWGLRAAQAQTSTGAVQGTVRDRSGGVIVGARVQLTNMDTNVSAEGRTNETGFYLFPGVNPGPYRLVVEASGMKPFEATLRVPVQQRVVIDPVMEVGEVATAVTVSDATPLVTLDSATLGQVLDRARIEQLPINGRSILNLLPAIPGLEAAKDYGSDGARAYGVRQGSHEFVLDGAGLSERMWGGIQRRPPGLDTIQEFRVESNNSSARYTRPLTIVISTKSGTNQLHGALFETNRNNGYGKARRREDFYEKAPFLNRNEFGASAGGPVYVPGAYDGRNRTFWFFAYEALRSVAPFTRGFQVPTPAMRSGDFRGLVDETGRRFTLYDPWSTNPQTWQRQPFAHRGELNVIDPSRMSPLAKQLFAITPEPTLPDVNPLVDNNWWGPVPNTNRQWTISARLDHAIGDKDRFYARYSQGDATVFRQFESQPMLNGVAGTHQRTSPNKSLASSWVRTFSPTFFNELLVSGSREVWFNSTGGPVKYADQLGLPNPFGANGWPGIYGTGLDSYFFETDNTVGTALTSFIADNNTTKIKGRHEFLFGGRFRYDQMNILADQQQPQGAHDFGSFATALYDPSSSRTNPDPAPFTGHNLANMYLGVMNYMNRFVRGYYYLRAKEYALYFQDNVRLTPRLTVNLGLRWDYWPPFAEKNNNMVSFDRGKKAIVLGQDLQTMLRLGYTLPSIVNTYQAQGVKFISRQEAGMPPSMFRTSRANLGPRLGFAYRALDGARSFVLRGGYRISYFPMPHRAWTGFARWSTPLTATFANWRNWDAASSPDGIALYGMRSVPTIIAGLNSRDAVALDNPLGLVRGSAFSSYFAPDQSEPRVQDWNLTLEKQVAEATVFRASYIGNHVGRLEQFYFFNEPTPPYIWFVTTGEPLPSGEFAHVAARPFDNRVYGTLIEYRKSGWSNYNGMQIELERRYSKGYAFHIFYNLSNALTAGGQSWASRMPEVNQFLPGRVPADYDQRNRFLNYRRDVSVPKHRVSWNWLADLPFGRDKLIGGRAGSGWNKLIGGWQVAGIGTLRSNYFQLPWWYYPTGERIEIYGYRYPIRDCRSGQCQPGYLWWNGYIPPHQINTPDGIQGIPANYKPAVQPLIPWPKDPVPNDPLAPFYGTNTTWVTLKDGTVQRTIYDDGLPPLRNQYAPGVRQWSLDASFFKTIPITERVSLRFNADFFNVLNHPGNPNAIEDDGLLSTVESGQAAREIQLTLRLTW